MHSGYLVYVSYRVRNKSKLHQSYQIITVTVFKHVWSTPSLRLRLGHRGVSHWLDTNAIFYPAQLHWVWISEISFV